MTFDDVCELVATWPGVEVSTSYGAPALKVKGRLLTRLREDGDTLVIRDVEPDERDMLIERDPDVFYMTEHYRDYPMVLVRLSRADVETVRGLLLRTWERLAPKPANPRA